MLNHDIVIVGGGPAGLTAAVYALRAGKTVLVIEKNGFGGQIAYSPKVENIPGTQLISGTVDPGVAGTVIVARGLQIGPGVNRLTAGGGQGVDFGVTAGVQGIVGRGGSCAGSANEEAAQGRKDQQQAKGAFHGFHFGFPPSILVFQGSFCRDLPGGMTGRMRVGWGMDSV